jgi:hypothetical protein
LRCSFDRSRPPDFAAEGDANGKTGNIVTSDRPAYRHARDFGRDWQDLRRIGFRIGPVDWPTLAGLTAHTSAAGAELLEEPV